MWYRRIVFSPEFLDRILVYLDNRTLHIPFRLVLTGDLLREFDNFHFLELNQIQLFKDSSHISKSRKRYPEKHKNSYLDF